MQRTPFTLTQGRHGPLRGDVYLPEHPRGVPVVIGCHGFKGFKDWGFWPEVGRRFAEAGLALVTFNFSGSGIGEDPESFTEVERFEANTIGKELEDLGVVIDALAGREIPLGGADIRKLGLLGHSRGGGVAVVRTSRDPRIRALVTWAAVATFLRVGDDERSLWRERGYLEIQNARTGQSFRVTTELLDDLEAHGEAYDLLHATRRLQVPFLVVHGTQDEAVPVEEAHLLAKNLDPGRGRMLLLEGAGHTFGAAHPFSSPTPALRRALDKTVAWFEEHLG